jgi:hypothetical protein
MYPENMAKMYIINAPWLFTAIFKIVRTWLDERTREKISVEGKDYLKVLLKDID